MRKSEKVERILGVNRCGCDLGGTVRDGILGLRRSSVGEDWLKATTRADGKERVVYEADEEGNLKRDI